MTTPGNSSGQLPDEKSQIGRTEISTPSEQHLPDIPADDFDNSLAEKESRVTIEAKPFLPQHDLGEDVRITTIEKIPVIISNIASDEHLSDSLDDKNTEAPHDAEFEDELHSSEKSISATSAGQIQNDIIDALSDDEVQIESSEESNSKVAFDDHENAASSGNNSSDTSDDSDSDSDSCSDSSSSSDSDESVKTTGKSLIDELEEEDEAITGPILSKNEVADEKAHSLPADYTIPPNAPLELIGTLTGLVEQSAIIKANVSGEFRILKDDSVLCFEDRQLLGPLFETFGRLQAPNYRVKFNTREEFEGIKHRKGSKVYYVVPEAKFIYTDALKKSKGTDASNCHDEELPEEEQEYSDDERELAAKQERTRKRKQKKQESGEDIQKRKPSAPKAENSFVSYGFASKQTAAPAPSAGSYSQLHHHNPAIHGSSQNHSGHDQPSMYGTPYAPTQSNSYGQALVNPVFSQQYQGQHSYAHNQTYMPANQYGHHTQSYQSPYGQPYNPALVAQTQQFQQPQYGFSQNGNFHAQHLGDSQPYGTFQQHASSPMYPSQQMGMTNHQAAAVTHPQSYTTAQFDAPIEALQQLQQMVSQNLASKQEGNEK